MADTAQDVLDDSAKFSAWLDTQPPHAVCEWIERSIALAVRGRDFPAVHDLLVLMCRFDPHRAGELRDTILDACDGKITLTVQVRP